MKQLSGKKKKICILSIIGIIIVAGIIVTVVLGFNKELKYKQNQSIEIYVEQKVDKNKIKDIANQVLGKPNLVETIEIYQRVIIEPLEQEIKKVKVKINEKKFFISKEIEKDYLNKLENLLAFYLEKFAILIKNELEFNESLKKKNIF